MPQHMALAPGSIFVNFPLLICGPEETDPMVGINIRLAEIIEALSQALDMTEGQPPGHCIRCCYIGTLIGREIGLGDSELQDLYYRSRLQQQCCPDMRALSRR